MLLIKPFSHS